MALQPSVPNITGAVQTGYSAPGYQAPSPLVQGPGAPTAAVLGDVTDIARQAATAPDPYAPWGGASAYNSLISGFNTQKQNIIGSANEAATQLQPKLANSVLDTIDSLRQAQKSIDLKNTQNEAAKIAGGQNVMAGVGRGIKSGNVMLANKNAGNSSAAGAIAAAYGDQGRRQLSQIGNEYAQNQGEIALDQENLGTQTTKAKRDFSQGIQDSVNSIVNDARSKLAQLDAAMADKSLPQRIAIEQEKENIRNNVLGQLQQYDSQLQQGVGGIQAQGQDANQAAARQQLQAGVAPENSFQYDQNVPGQFQDTGPFAAGGTPLFTLGAKRRVTA